MRKLNYVSLTILCFGLCLGQADLYAQKKVKPNIVFIYADDWGWGDLSCHGSKWLKTPNIDKFAGDGIDFQQFNVLNPVCSPSRVAALTGRYPSRFGINSVFSSGTYRNAEQPDWLDIRAPSTVRFLKEAGYHTGHYGKWHMGDEDDSPYVTEYGFDEAAIYHGRGNRIKENNVADSAVAFISRNKNKPFYLNVWLHESHTSHSPSEKAKKLWENETDEQRKIYGAVISDGDLKVGQILKALDDAGIANNTVVVFSSDNGPESTSTSKGTENKWGSYYSIGETAGFRGRKRSLYEGGVRVPFIVRWPGHTPKSMINNTTVISAVDLLPTFCEAAGVTVPASAKCDGESLLAAFNGKTIKRTRPIYWLHTGANTLPDKWPRLAVREGDWKLVSNFDGSKIELHNMRADGFEKTENDLSKSNPEIASKLFQMVSTWYKTLPKTADPLCISVKKTPRANKENSKKKK